MRKKSRKQDANVQNKSGHAGPDIFAIKNFIARSEHSPQKGNLFFQFCKDFFAGPVLWGILRCTGSINSVFYKDLAIGIYIDIIQYLLVPEPVKIGDPFLRKHFPYPLDFSAFICTQVSGTFWPSSWHI